MFHRSIQLRFSWISWIDRWHTDSQQCSEPRLQTVPAKATGGRQDYHDFEAPFKSSQVSASACITGVNWLNTSIRSFFLYRIDLYLGPVRSMRCFVTPDVDRFWCNSKSLRFHRREPVNSSHGQRVTPLFLWRVDRFFFRVVWRVDCSVLGGVWRVDCRYSSHELACLLTYETKYHCWHSLSHLQSIFMLFLVL